MTAPNDLQYSNRGIYTNASTFGSHSPTSANMSAAPQLLGHRQQLILIMSLTKKKNSETTKIGYVQSVPARNVVLGSYSGLFVYVPQIGFCNNTNSGNENEAPQTSASGDEFNNNAEMANKNSYPTLLAPSAVESCNPEPCTYVPQYAHHLVTWIHS